MKPEKQRIAIAKACGWTHIYVAKSSNHLPSPNGPWLGSNPAKTEVAEIPDYFNDLNAMHEAEGKLTLGQCSQYLKHLYDILPCREWNKIALIHATAAQRAEAFLRTLGKWEDEA